MSTNPSGEAVTNKKILNLVELLDVPRCQAFPLKARASPTGLTVRLCSCRNSVVPEVGMSEVIGMTSV